MVTVGLPLQVQRPAGGVRTLDLAAELAAMDAKAPQLPCLLGAALHGPAQTDTGKKADDIAAVEVAEPIGRTSRRKRGGRAGRKANRGNNAVPADGALPASAASVLARCEMHADQMLIGDVVTELRTLAKQCEVDGDHMQMQHPGCFDHCLAVARDPRLMIVVRRLEQLMGTISLPRDYMNIFWSLGKVGVTCQSVDPILFQAVKAFPAMINKFTSMELSNTLWGLARLHTHPESEKSSSSSKNLVKIAHIVIDEGIRKLDTFGDQCLANSLWSIAKLELVRDGKFARDEQTARAQAVVTFIHGCIQKTISSHLQNFLPQGFANSLWAVAKCCQDIELAKRFCLVACGAILATPGILSNFLPQELSMGVWAVARVMQQWRRGHTHPLPEAVEGFALAAAVEAHMRMDGLSPQALSNLAWGFVTLDLGRAGPVRGFILTGTIVACSNGLQQFSPQAIANLCWALSKIPQPESLTSTFFEAATRAAVDRAHDFTWQDLASIASAMMNSGAKKEPYAMAFTTWLVQQAYGRCHRMGTQALLNIAVAAKRVGVASEAILKLAVEIQSVFALRNGGLNEIDRRQWLEVCEHCHLPSPV